MAKQEVRVQFNNVSVSPLVKAECTPELREHRLETMVLAFIELAEEGVKVSFSYKADKNSYVVAITLPPFDVQGTPVSECATFWDGDLFEALAEAYVATFIFKAYRGGWEDAKAAMKLREKKIADEIIANRTRHE